jgi:hypothetical protein
VESPIASGNEWPEDLRQIAELDQATVRALSAEPAGLREVRASACMLSVILILAGLYLQLIEVLGAVRVYERLDDMNRFLVTGKRSQSILTLEVEERARTARLILFSATLLVVCAIPLWYVGRSSGGKLGLSLLILAVVNTLGMWGLNAAIWWR